MVAIFTTSDTGSDMTPNYTTAARHLLSAVKFARDAKKAPAVSGQHFEMNRAETLDRAAQQFEMARGAAAFQRKRAA